MTSGLRTHGTSFRLRARPSIGRIAKIILIPFVALVAVAAQSSSALAAGPALTVTYPNSAPIEGTAVNGVIATFSDPIADPAANFTASIAWGDGTITTGTVAGSGGSYTVSGSHTYADEMSLTATVSIADSDGSSGTGTASVTVGEGDNGSLSGRALTLSVNTAYTGPVASFTDVLLGQVAGDWVATVNWGDGSTGPGIVTGGSGNFLISGTHTYTTIGAYSLITMLSEDPPSPISNVAIVGSANVVVPFTMTAGNVAAAEGTAFNGTVATFTDNIGADALANYSATIAWGDGTTSAGTIAGIGTNNFSVSGSHVYADEGSFTTAIALADSDGSAANAGAAATVTDADTFAGTGSTLTLAPGASFNGAVATFTDTNATQSAADLVVSINWGDGTTTAGTVSGGSGTFTANGAHSYANLGTYTISAGIGEDSAATQLTTATGSAHIVVPVTLTASSISAAEGTAFSGTVATFTDNLGSDALTNYSATISWGDGTSSAATIAGNGAGGFNVNGSHTYADEGSMALSVSMADSDGYTATGSGAAAVADTDTFVGSGTSLTLATNTAYTGTVATFTDSNTTQSSADLTASINWGDGSSGPGIVSGGNGTFSVSGTHAYPTNGTYGIAITLSEDTGSGASTATSSASVVTPMTAAASAVNTGEGAAFSGPVATFTDNLGTNPLPNYAATITWGDGSSSAGTISNNGGNTFTVSGTHLYADEGSYATNVSISDSDGSSASASGAAAVADTDHLTGTAAAISAAPGAAFSGTVATFANSASGASSTDFTATIDWGDGASNAGSIAGSATAMTVSGAHTYAAAGTFSVTVSLHDDVAGAATASIVSTASIAGGITDTFKPDVSIAFATAGHAYSGAAGRFDDSNKATSAGALPATIKWGDGSASSTGTVARARHGDLVVSGAHTYAHAGVYIITVSIATPSGSAHGTTRTLMLVRKADSGDDRGDGNHNGDDSGNNSNSGHHDPTPSPTAASTPVPTATAAPTAEPSAAPTGTPAATATAAPTAGPTATPAPTSPPTSAPTSTPAPTATPAPTSTPTPAPTSTPTPTPIPCHDGGEHHNSGGDHC